MIDAASFTGVRLASGAVALVIIAGAARVGASTKSGGNWISAVALFAYAAAFSFAYVRIEAGVGALLLFGTVQVTMIGWGWSRGERPALLVWVGVGVALIGLVALTSPGREAPDLPGAGLMIAAGVAWGVYSLRGRATVRPLAATAVNFLLTLPAAAVLVVVSAASVTLTAKGVLLAVLSGALASGVGYSLWYAAIPRMPAARAAVVQLAVPVLAAAAGVALLGETPSVRLVVSGLAILAGVAIALRARTTRPGA